MLLCLLLFNFTITRVDKLWAKMGKFSLGVNIWWFLIKWVLRETFVGCQHCLDNVSKCKHFRRGIIHRNHSSWIKRFTKEENWTGRNTWSYYFLFKCVAAIIILTNSCVSHPEYRTMLETPELLERTKFTPLHDIHFRVIFYFSHWFWTVNFHWFKGRCFWLM